MNKVVKLILIVVLLIVICAAVLFFSKCSCSNAVIKRPDSVKSDSDYVLFLNNVK